MADERHVSPATTGASRESSEAFAAPDSAAAVEALVDAHQNALIRYAYRMLRSRELAQDVVQEAFLRYLRKPLDYGEPRQRAAWLYRVTHNLCVDHIKRESKRGDVHRQAERTGAQEMPENGVVAAEEWRRLRNLLERLSTKQRSVVLLFFEEDLTYKEIAKVTGFSMSNVGMLLHRGLKKLRAIIEEEGLD